MIVPTTPDIKRLRSTLKYIEDHPEEWDQNFWGQQTECGTSYCFAGTVVHQAGYQMRWSIADTNGLQDAELLLNGRTIASVARKILGLNETQSWDLFAPHNSLDDIKDVIDYIEDESRNGGPSRIEDEDESW